MEFSNLIEKVLSKCSLVISEEKEKLIQKEELNNIPYGYFRIMYWITLLEEPTVTSLAKVMNMTKPTITVHIQKMQKAGLVYKEKSNEDKRVSYIRLSETGKRVEEAEKNAFDRLSNIVEEKLSKSDWNTFKRLLEELI